MDTLILANAVLFLSTLSLRRATACYSPALPERYNFYPRSPCGERRHKTAKLIINVRFLSTLSLRRATRAGHTSQQNTLYFYPRSPCGERPSIRHISKTRTKHLYPRSPCGERHPVSRKKSRNPKFLSTLSLRRATTLSRYRL